MPFRPTTYTRSSRTSPSRRCGCSRTIALRRDSNGGSGAEELDSYPASQRLHRRCGLVKLLGQTRSQAGSESQVDDKVYAHKRPESRFIKGIITRTILSQENITVSACHCLERGRRPGVESSTSEKNDLLWSSVERFDFTPLEKKPHRCARSCWRRARANSLWLLFEMARTVGHERHQHVYDTRCACGTFNNIVKHGSRARSGGFESF
jgi:hypothetical protein